MPRDTTCVVNRKREVSWAIWFAEDDYLANLLIEGVSASRSSAKSLKDRIPRTEMAEEEEFGGDAGWV